MNGYRTKDERLSIASSRENEIANNSAVRRRRQTADMHHFSLRQIAKKETERDRKKQLPVEEEKTSRRGQM